MNNRWNLGVKLTLFVVFAVLFAGTLIFLSGNYKRSEARSYSSDDGKQSYHETYEVSPNDNLFVDCDMGDVIVKGTSENTVDVKVSFSGDQDLLDKYKVKIEHDGNTVKVSAKHRGSRLFFFDNNWFDARFEITVPKNFNLDVSTSGGNLDVTDVTGEIKASTSGGDVYAENLDGRMKLETSGGNVTAINLKDDVDLQTSGGDISGEKISGVLRAETSGGNIKIKDSDAEVRASTSGGNIKTDLRDNKGIDLSTSGGDITVLLPEGISAEVDAEATGGDVNCDFAFQGKLRDGSMHGKINGGGKQISLETSGGSIDITSRLRE